MVPYLAFAVVGQWPGLKTNGAPKESNLPIASYGRLPLIVASDINSRRVQGWRGYRQLIQ